MVKDSYDECLGSFALQDVKLWRATVSDSKDPLLVKSIVESHFTAPLPIRVLEHY